jgi:hypothetical protein
MIGLIHLHFSEIGFSLPILTSNSRYINRVNSMESNEGAAVQTISELLERYGQHASNDTSIAEQAKTWIDLGYDDVDEVESWLKARCFNAEGANMLDNAGITPEQAAITTTEGMSQTPDTIGFKVVNGDLTVDEARRIVTREFWND